MCELNFKRKAVFTIEFFTSHDMDEDTWNAQVIGRLMLLEQQFNASGVVRVHIHQTEEDSNESRKSEATR